MITASGVEVSPTEGAPTLEDIAISLGRTVRFRGHTRDVYTCLDHSLVVTALVKPENRIHALLHDAAEAIIGDIPTTWKTEDMKRLEAHLMRRIYRSLGVRRPGREAKADVKQADLRALAAEAYVLGHPAADRFWPEPDSEALQITRSRHIGRHLSWPPQVAVVAFDAAFQAAMSIHAQKVAS